MDWIWHTSKKLKKSLKDHANELIVNIE